MTVATQLSVLESSGLVLVSQIEPELEYLFRHALVQEVAYGSLLKIERVHLHRLAGEALEALYPDHLDELAPRLAEHYWQAGELSKALQYLLQAAEAASRRYATAEAVGYYNRALEASGGDPLVRRQILAERGRLFEATGEFERSRADQEDVVALARASGDPMAEWRALIDLGLLWAARDYRRTGRYYRAALKLARKIGDDQVLAHSLNRLGNYAINIDKPRRSYRSHREALSIFSRLHDDAGLAETLDLLGMANALGGDLVQSRRYLERAAEIFEKIGDRRGATSARITQAVMTLDHQTEMVVTSGISTDEGIGLAQTARREAASIGWRAGEIYSLSALGFCLTARGDFERALDTTAAALRLAEEIQHRQWELFARLTSGVTYLDLLAYERAEECLACSLSIAREINSVHWIHTACATQAMTRLGRADAAGAAALLNANPLKEDLVYTLGQRLMWCVRAETALALGDAPEAMRICDRLMAASANLKTGQTVLRLWRIRAEVLSALAREAVSPEQAQGYRGEAEALLRMALRESEDKNYRSRIWRVWLALARLWADQGRDQDAADALRTAHSVVDSLAANIADPALRDNFQTQARSVLAFPGASVHAV